MSVSSDSRNSWPDMGRFTREPVDGIIPDDFPERWGCEPGEIARALRVAEAAPSSSDLSEAPRCKECLSTQVFEKTGGEMEHKRPEPYKCGDCSAQLTELVYPDSAGDYEVSHDTNAPATAERPPIMTETDFSPTTLPTSDDLENARTDLALSTTEIDGAGSSYSAIRSWERGQTSPELWRLRALLVYYQLVDGRRRADRLADAIGWEEGDQ